MKQTDLTKSIDKAIKIKMLAVDRLIEELVEPLEDIGNPEKLIGKKYSDWNPQELAMMIQVYGNKDNSPLSNLIFREKYKEVKELEAAEL